MKNPSTPKKVTLFYRPDHPAAEIWAAKIRAWLGKKHPGIVITDKKPEAVIVLGGDGTILEAASRYAKITPVILGLNLGHVGFLAAARAEEKFMGALARFFSGKYWLVERMMLEAGVWRNGKNIFFFPRDSLMS